MKYHTQVPSLSSGYPGLDAALPQAGWPVGALTEILVSRVGHGELNLLGPLLARLTRAGRTVALLVPPYLSYAPALIQHGVALECVKLVRSARPLDDGLDQIETAVRSGEFAALVAILPPDEAAVRSEGTVRRLLLAARLSGCPAFLFHTCSTPATTSVSQLRLLADMSQAGELRLQRIAPDDEAGRGAVTLEIGQREPRAGFRRVAGLALAGTRFCSAAQLNEPDETAAVANARPVQAPPEQGAPRAKPASPGRSRWPFKQRGSSGGAGSSPAGLAFWLARSWNA